MRFPLEIIRWRVLPSISLLLVLGFITTKSFAQQDTSDLKQLTDSLVSISTQKGNSQSAAHAQEVANERYDLLLKLAASSPEKALQLMLPADVLSRLPKQAKPYLEQDADETGEFEIMVEDYPDGTHRMRYFLKTARERLEMHFAAHPPTHLETGAHVRAHGKRIDSVLVLSSGTEALTTDATTASLQTLALASSSTFGAQSTVVLLVNFNGNTAQPTTVEAARSLVFTTVSNFDEENSQNQTWLTGDVFGWYTIAFAGGTCDTNTLATQANQAATSAGVNLNNYKRIVYMFPNISACGWAGLGTIGGSPSQAWINGYATNSLVVAHEMGHNFGLYHSHTAPAEYGDLFDTMGNTTNSHFNSFQKERLGWLNYGSSAPITSVTSSGTYTITPYESGSGSKALKIAKDSSGNYYYVEYRQLTGFDSSLSTYSAATHGVLVHTGSSTDPNSSYLLDMNAGTTSYNDAALAVGQSYTDATANVTIQLVSADTTGAIMSVSIGGSTACMRANPTLTISPAQAASVAAGTNIAYSISVTNNDSTNCPTSTIDLSAAVPSGWTSAYTTTALNLAPKATATTTLNVASASSAANGISNVTATATNASASTYKGSATATYTVANPTAIPTLAASSTSALSVVQGSSGMASIATTVGGGFNSAVNLTASGQPAGVTVSFNPATIAAPGAGSSTLTFAVGASAVTGTYPVKVTATGSSLTATTTVNLTITPAAVTLRSISVTPANSSIAAASTAQMKATGTYSDNTTKDLTSQVSWSSSNTSISTVSSTGLATGVSGGTATISAIFGAISASTSLTITVPVSLRSIALTPANGSISSGSTVLMRAAGTYSDNSTKDLTSQVSWKSSNSTVATVSTAGLVSGAAAGTVTISASLGSVSGSTSVTVTSVVPPPPPPSSGAYSLFAPSAVPAGSAQIGQAVELGVKFYADQAGYISAIRFYKGPNNTGVHTGRLWTQDGQALAAVTFSNESDSGWQQANLSMPIPVTANTTYVVSYHSTGSYSVDQSYFASAFDHPPLHASANYGSAGGNGVIGFGPDGTFPIVPSTSGSNYWVDVVFTTSTTTTAASLTSISVTPENPSLAAGAAQQMKATGTYSDNTTRDLTSQVSWTSSNSAVASVSGAGVVSGLGAGSSTVSAALNGVRGSTTVTVPTTTVSLRSIAVTPANPTVAPGATQQMKATATYSDNSTRDVTSQASWSSSNMSVATINSSGLVTGLNTGPSTITAIVSGIAGNTAVTVMTTVAPPPASGATLFSASAVPAAEAQTNSSVEVGMKFYADRNGYITAIRFYKGPNNAGLHTGHIWTSDGIMLAAIDFTNESGSGWQEAKLAYPLMVAANTIYVVSYHSNGDYSLDDNYFANPVDHAPLHAPANNGSAGSNGVYISGSNASFPIVPTSSGRNYWVDVVFQ